jgi:hypothetical protein
MVPPDGTQVAGVVALSLILTFVMRLDNNS